MDTRFFVAASAGGGIQARGIVLPVHRHASLSRTREACMQLLAATGLQNVARCTEEHDGAAGLPALRLSLPEGLLQAWAPGHDTTGLHRPPALPPATGVQGLEREIWLALLASPVDVACPSVAELSCAVRLRLRTVQAARRTLLDFRTSSAERPADCWTQDRDGHHVVRPGVPLATALRKATQPGASGTLYSFSCYRATEYVLLLALAQELRRCNPPLLRRLQALCERRIVRSGEFHDVFLRETGSIEQPLPLRYLVPGDRVWFRNPDAHSSNAPGYEGSWVFYLGRGLYSNFWQRRRPFTLEAKCVEIHHWRHATWVDADGELRIDESVVAQRVAATLRDPQDTQRILAQMMRPRDPRGVHAEGGCLDVSREGLRWVCPGTADLQLPAE